jgi:mutator protein MutT
MFPPPSPDPIWVVAAVISRAGRFLLGRRPDDKRHGGLWEFPGGKLEAGESWGAAAARELAEELGLRLESIGEQRFETQDPGSRYRIRFLQVEVSGALEAREHSAVGWFTPEELAGMPLAPSDAAFVRTLFDDEPEAEPPPRR